MESFQLKKSGQLFYTTSPLDMKTLMGDHATDVSRIIAWNSIDLKIPPIDERFGIDREIAQRLTEIDKLQTEAYFIELYQERIPLLSAAVTGKIEVQILERVDVI